MVHVGWCNIGVKKVDIARIERLSKGIGEQKWILCHRERSFRTSDKRTTRGLQEDYYKQQASHGDEEQDCSYHDYAIPSLLHLTRVCWHLMGASCLAES